MWHNTPVCTLMLTIASVITGLLNQLCNTDEILSVYLHNGITDKNSISQSQHVSIIPMNEIEFFKSYGAENHKGIICLYVNVMSFKVKDIV